MMADGGSETGLRSEEGRMKIGLTSSLITVEFIRKK
jgi:hypothetical protein